MKVSRINAFLPKFQICLVGIYSNNIEVQGRRSIQLLSFFLCIDSVRAMESAFLLRINGIAWVSRFTLLFGLLSLTGEYPGPLTHKMQKVETSLRGREKEKPDNEIKMLYFLI